MERLTPEQIADMKEYFSRSKEVKTSSLAMKLSHDGLKLIDTIESQQQEIESLIAEKDELIELLKAARSRLPNAMRFCVCGKCKSCGEQIPYTNHIYCDHCLIILIDKVIGGVSDGN